MKTKRLLLLAWTVTALTSAHAQTQQVASASSIGIVPGNLAIDGKAYPVGYDTNKDGSKTINVYDNSFNVKNSSVIPTSTYEYKTTTEESTVKGTVIYDENRCNFENGEELDPDSTISTPDDFLRFIYYNRYVHDFASLEAFKRVCTCMTDEAGRFIIVPQETLFDNCYSYCPTVGKLLPYMELSWVDCYNPTNRKWNGYAKVVYWIDYDPSQATSWTVVSTSNHSIKKYPSICKIYFVDADKGIEGKYLGSQNLFNTDAKTEFILNDYKEVSKEEYDESNSDQSNNYNVSKVRYGSDIVLSRSSQDKFYVPVLSIINEDGTKLYDIGSSYLSNYSSTIDIIRLDGSLYIKSLETDYEAVYSFSPETGIKEVARVKASNASRAYNLAGQQVNADAKGIIIRDGKKFLNK